MASFLRKDLFKDNRMISGSGEIPPKGSESFNINYQKEHNDNA